MWAGNHCVTEIDPPTLLTQFGGWRPRSDSLDFRSLLSLVRCVFRGFTDRTLDVLAAAHQDASARDHVHVAPEHVLLAMAKAERGVGLTALARLGVDLREKIAQLDALVGNSAPKSGGNRRPSFSPETELLLADAKSESKTLGHDYVGTEHLLLALLKCDGPAGECLKTSGVTAERIRDEVREILAG